MKKLILAAALFTASAAYSADPNALCALNEAGGQIIVTTQELDGKRVGLVVGTSKDGKTMYGAWRFVSNRIIHIEWESGATTVLDLKSLIPCRY